MKNLILILAIFGALILGCSAPQNSPKTETKTNETKASPAAVPDEKPIEIKAADLVKAYKENELAADDKFKDKKLQVTGRVQNIADTLGSLTVSLTGQSFVTVMCRLSADSKDAAKKLKTGQTVTIIGTGDGMTGGFYVGLQDCTIK